MVGVMDSVVTARNRFCCIMSRSPVREACAEFFATFVLVVLGDSVMANCILGRLSQNSAVVGAFGWGLAVMVAVAIAGGVSGGHVNPAVTVGLASVKKCSLKHVFPYMAAQYVGSFLAAGVVYGCYIDAIELYDGGIRRVIPSMNSTAQIFATYPQEFASSWTCFWDQVVATALLLIVICAATDSKTLGVPHYSQPIIIGLGVTGIIFAFGRNCGAPLNPARDLAPRLFTAISGWGKDVFSFRSYNWFWIPVIAPHVGGIIGAQLYKVFVVIPAENSRPYESEDCDFAERERRVGGLEANLSSTSVDIPAEDAAYRHAIDKAVRDGKLAVDVCIPANLEKRDLADV